MQPYFFPYLGYYRLLAAADTFVILDNVQHQRRGWIHRNKFLKSSGAEDWLTLPIIKGDRDNTLIKDVEFRENIDAKELIGSFQIGSKVAEIQSYWPNFLTLSGSLLDYLEETIVLTGNLLGFNPNVVRASRLAEKKDLSGEDYIVSLCKELEAETYINAPGGRFLYGREKFEEKCINLKFLSEYVGPKTNVLERILNEDIKNLKEEVSSNLEFQQP